MISSNKLIIMFTYTNDLEPLLILASAIDP